MELQGETPQFRRPFQSCSLFPLEALCKEQETQRGPWTVLGGGGVDLLAPGEVYQARSHSAPGCRPRLQSLLEHREDAERQTLWGLGVWFVPAWPAVLSFLSRSWRAALAARGARLSKYVKYPLSLGGRM